MTTLEERRKEGREEEWEVDAGAGAAAGGEEVKDDKNEFVAPTPTSSSKDQTCGFNLQHV
jgi:hypothetical protein